MKNFLPVAIGFIIIAAIAFFLISQGNFLSQNSISNQSTTQTQNSSSNTGSSNANTSEETLTASNYVEYTGPETLEENKNPKRVLFFYANWCPTCRPVNRNLTNNPEDIPEDLTIIRVNYNDTNTDQNEEALAEKYGVTYQHTFVQIDENGNALQKWNGGDLDDIISRTN